jgi:hypothetical protein
VKKLTAWLKFLASLALCLPALFMPYRVRTLYAELLGWLFQAPFLMFGALARAIMRRLDKPA